MILPGMMKNASEHSKETKKRTFRGIAFKLILSIFICCSVIFAILFAYNLKITRSIVVRNLINSATYLTESTVAKIDKVLNSIQTIPDNFAPIIERNLDNEAEMKQLVRLMVANNPDILGAALAFEPYSRNPREKYFSYYFHRKGDYINFITLGNEHYDYFTMDWYQLPKELGRGVWSEPYFDEGGANMLMTTYAVPIYREREGKKVFAGVLTVDLSLDWLQHYVGRIKVNETGYGVLISQNGTIVSYPLKKFIMNETIFSIADEQKSPELREVGRKMVHGESGFSNHEYKNSVNGKPCWLAYAPVTLNRWSIGIFFPVEEIMADATHLSIVIFALGAGGFCGIVILIVLIARSITSPLRRLTQAAEMFAAGDFNVKLPYIRSRDEIGRLNVSFIVMQQKLAATIGELRNASEQLMISNEKLEEYNRTLEQKVEIRTSELQQKHIELESAFTHLKDAQAQLVQSEKMASLGQLTAGIAHEIKNPLNFINNFSEVSVELAAELIQELDKPGIVIDEKESGYIKGIIADIEGNARRIHEHGKRADSIIRSMLLHSRGKSGERQPTDINALLEEYVKLGYHGMRATDNTFNIKIESEYDPELKTISVVPQDISRVFLNMINNAFYSTAQKKKELKEAYFPVLRVKTMLLNDTVEIRIFDNGKGMSKDTVERVFNPFFTTKPAGSGTGLGLSISYDIIVRQHNGQISVVSEEGEFAEFIITLPVT
jgi:signal transduction histidine kinase